MEVGAAAVGDTEPQELVAGPSALGRGGRSRLGIFWVLPWWSSG